jgi:hypothetical protein
MGTPEKESLTPHMDPEYDPPVPRGDKDKRYPQLGRVFCEREAVQENKHY